MGHLHLTQGPAKRQCPGRAIVQSTVGHISDVPEDSSPPISNVANSRLTSDSPPSDPPRRWWLLAAKGLIVALVAWFIGRTIYDAWDGLADYSWRIRPTWLLVAGSLYLAG